jgi:hypothetical protein
MRQRSRNRRIGIGLLVLLGIGAVAFGNNRSDVRPTEKVLARQPVEETASFVQVENASKQTVSAPADPKIVQTRLIQLSYLAGLVADGTMLLREFWLRRAW